MKIKKYLKILSNCETPEFHNVEENIIASGESLQENKIIFHVHENGVEVPVEYRIQLDPKDIRKLMKWQMGHDEYNENQRKHEEKQIQEIQDHKNMGEGIDEIHVQDSDGKWHDFDLKKIEENQKRIDTWEKTEMERLTFDNIEKISYVNNSSGFFCLNCKTEVKVNDIVYPSRKDNEEGKLLCDKCNFQRIVENQKIVDAIMKRINTNSTMAYEFRELFNPILKEATGKNIKDL